MEDSLPMKETQTTSNIIKIDVANIKQSAHCLDKFVDDIKFLIPD